MSLEPKSYDLRHSFFFHIHDQNIITSKVVVAPALLSNMKLRPAILVVAGILLLIYSVQLFQGLKFTTTIISPTFDIASIRKALGDAVDSDGMLVNRVLDLGTHQIFGVSEFTKLSYRRKGVGFMDITDHLEFYANQEKRDSPDTQQQDVNMFPVDVNYTSQVENLIKTISIDRMKKSLAKLTSFHNRYYKSHYGFEASMWIHDQAQAIAQRANEMHGLSGGSREIYVRAFEHKWAQRSIIATIPGMGVRSKTDDHRIILSTHLDSANFFFPAIIAAPGADDNGSGTVTLLEVFQALCEGGFAGLNHVEFHWYSGEESGLLGSQDVMTSYSKRGIDVKALFHQDVTGYTPPAPVNNVDDSAAHLGTQVGVFSDFTDPALTHFLKKVVTAYTALTVVEQKCGYACSDHASATRVGYPACVMIEGPLKNTNPWMHIVGDTVDKINWSHMKEHGKVSLGMAVELSMSPFS